MKRLEKEEVMVESGKELLGKLKTFPETQDNAICISSKFGNHMAPLALVTKLATRWRHLNWLQFDHQIAPLTLVTHLPTRLSHLNCHITLDCPIGIISQCSVELIDIFIKQSHIS